jgi:hypothetical protein
MAAVPAIDFGGCWTKALIPYIRPMDDTKRLGQAPVTSNLPNEVVER